MRLERGSIWPRGEKIDAPGYPVEIYNILGAGDAFGAGFLYGYVKRLGLAQVGPVGQCLWGDRRHQARLRQLHADLW